MKNAFETSGGSPPSSSKSRLALNPTCLLLIFPLKTMALSSCCDPSRLSVTFGSQTTASVRKPKCLEMLSHASLATSSISCSEHVVKVW